MSNASAVAISLWVSISISIWLQRLLIAFRVFSSLWFYFAATPHLALLILGTAIRSSVWVCGTWARQLLTARATPSTDLAAAPFRGWTVGLAAKKAGQMGSKIHILLWYYFQNSVQQLEAFKILVENIWIIL